MVEGPTVVVTGADEKAVARTASALRKLTDSFAVATAPEFGEAGESEESNESTAGYCLVADGTEETVVERICERHPEVPVVLFGDGDERSVEAVLADGAADYVQRSGDGRYAVLAHRIERALREAEDGNADTGRAGDGAATGVARSPETITQLQAISRDLMQAPSRESIAGVVTRAVETVLDYDMSVVRLYDREEGVLEPISSSENAVERMGERPTYSLDEGLPGKVFASGEPAVYDDVKALDDDFDRGPVRASMFFPIGVHGTLSIGATTSGAFDEVDRTMSALLATNAAAACNRARREREVREARHRIATILDRIEGVVQDTVEVLVEAHTREEVELGVCTQLAAAEPYVFAWLARPDVRGEALVAHEWTGEANLYVADESVPMDGDSPGAVAYRTGTSQVVDARALAEAGSGWLRTAHEASVESVMAIPLEYTDASYGVLYVCAGREDAFDGREQVVLESLGRAVANTINAFESGRILSADRVIELEFAVEDHDLLFSRLSATTGAQITSTGTVTQEDGSLRIYFTTTGADSDDVMDALQDDGAITAASRVAEYEGEALFDVTVDGSLVETLVDLGAVPKRIESEHGVVRYTIELPYEAEARDVFGLVDERYDNTDLVGYHEHERPVHTQQEFRAALFDRFTDRQETALRTAFLGGFFDWPREVDGDELAEGMDISRPTYHQHLRAAQQKVFQELFDPEGH
jgi:predicted DNA binding protein/GAF domain-containing protein